MRRGGIRASARDAPECNDELPAMPNSIERLRLAQNPKLLAALEALLHEARSDDQCDRRGSARYPFFRPVTLAAADGSLASCLAFTRELSLTGIGLMHDRKLATGLVTVKLERQSVAAVRLPVEVLWCRPVGHGWYLSGGRFTF